MSKQARNTNVDALYDAHKQTIEKHLTLTREQLQSKLKKDNPDLSDDDILDIPVTYDGTWQPCSQALCSCGGEDPGRGWSHVTRISRDKFEIYRGRGRKGAY